MRILITGGAGFIGSNLADHFLEQGHEVTILDNLFSGKLENLKHIKNKIKFIRGDVRNAGKLAEACRDIDAICHLAGISVVPISFEKPKETFDINVTGTLNVLQTAVKFNIPKIIFSSSAAVYGNPKTSEPIREDFALYPQSPYAISKVAAEHLLKVFADEHGLDACSLRLFNVYGPRQDPELSNAAVPTFIAKALKNEPIVIHGDGSQTRDFIFVKDVARAFELAIKMNTAGDIFNIASSKSTSILELANKIKLLMNSESDIVITEQRKGDINKSLADISKASALGFECKCNFKAGLSLTINYYKL